MLFFDKPGEGNKSCFLKNRKAENQPEKEKLEKGITRREALKKIGVCLGAMAAGAEIKKTIAHAFDSEDNEKAYYSYSELKTKYEDYYNNSSGRRNKIIKEGGKYLADYGNEKIEVPQKFIDILLTHLEQAKKLGYYDFLFCEDLGHCHVGLPKAHFEQEYKGMDLPAVRKKSLNDPMLMHLYHSRECLEPENSLNKNRNFLGYFDGRPIKLIHPKKDNESHTVFDYDREEMAEYNNYLSLEGGIVYFEGHKDGIFELSDGTRLDIDI